MFHQEGEADGRGDSVRVHALADKTCGWLPLCHEAQRDLTVLAFWQVVCERLGDGQSNFSPNFVVVNTERDAFDVAFPMPGGKPQNVRV